MSGNDENDRPEQPRQPRNLQGLLKFAMEATKDEDPTRPSEFHQMDPERRRFLEEALKSLTIDVVEELNKAMKTLTDENSSEDDQVTSLEVVTNFVADIDTANDFFKIGGFCIILPCLNSNYSVVRSETAMLIGELAQNNPFCQKHLLDLQVLPKLIELLSDEPKVAVNSFHAISCIVRSYEPGLASFIEIGGLECILGLIQCQDQEKLIIKSMFLISSFSRDFPAVRDELVKLDAIDRVAATLEPKSTYDTRLEQTLCALDALIETDEAIQRCRNKKSNFREQLERIISFGEGKDDCIEQIEFSKNLIAKVFK
ncbi:hsp70-binding protein 1 [Chironomus tepperi]|uniref:hsp70-binding protein 1 n=1 Tax=Chironomus tepperi TaxID=113505 RepID=UPI00391F58FF